MEIRIILLWQKYQRIYGHVIKSQPLKCHSPSKLFNPKVSYKKKRQPHEPLPLHTQVGRRSHPRQDLLANGCRASDGVWSFGRISSSSWAISDGLFPFPYVLVMVVTLPLSLTPRMLGNRKSRVDVLFHSFISLLLSQSDSLSAFACCLSFLSIVLIHLPHPFPDTFKTFMDIEATLGQIWLQKTLHVAWYLVPFLNHWNLLTFRKSKKNFFIPCEFRELCFLLLWNAFSRKTISTSPHWVSASGSVWRDTVLQASPCFKLVDRATGISLLPPLWLSAHHRALTILFGGVYILLKKIYL